MCAAASGRSVWERRRLAALVAGGLLVAPCLARAQYVPDYFPAGVPGYDQQLGVTVVTRVQPLYVEPEVRVGSFLLKPTIDESTGYNSNVLGLSGGAGSWFLETKPSLQIHSDWSRNSLGASISADNTRYIHTPNQSATNWQAAIGGGYTIGRSELTLGYSHLELNERPTDLGAPPSSTPIPYTVDDLRSDYTFDLGRLKITPNLDFSQWRFGSTTSAFANVPKDQGFRDRDVIQGGGAFRYELSGKTSLLMVLQGANSQFVHPEPLLQPSLSQPPPLSSTSGTALVGIDYQYDGLWRYQLLVGGEVRSFAASQFATRVAPIAQGTVIWTPTGLTTVTASVLRTLQDPTEEGTSGYTYTRAQARVDHEYLRDVLLDGEVGIQNAAYQTGATQTEYAGRGGITWLLNRNLHLSLSYQYTKRIGAPSVVSAVGTVPVCNNCAVHLIMLQLHADLALVHEGG